MSANRREAFRRKLKSVSELEYELSAGIDWLTVTSQDDDIGHKWQGIYHRDKLDAQKLGKVLREKDFRLMGYTGKSFDGGVKVGYSPRLGWIAICSGGTANSWRMFVGSDVNVTRIDLAITVNLGLEIKDVPRMYWECIQEEEKKKRTYSIIENSKGGQTLYVGSRKSSRMGRVYDKGAESGSSPPGFKYRYEVEVKKPLSGQIVSALSAVSNVEADVIQRTVYHFFNDRGVPPLFREAGDRVKLETVVRVSTLDRKLQWIRSQVRPSVQELIVAGRSEELFSALGINTQDMFSVACQDGDGIAVELPSGLTVEM